MSSGTQHPLREWRLGQKLSVKECAARVPCARQTWHSWERRNSLPPEDMMVRLVEMTAGAVQPNDFYDLPDLSLDAREAA